MDFTVLEKLKSTVCQFILYPSVILQEIQDAWTSDLEATVLTAENSGSHNEACKTLLEKLLNLLKGDRRQASNIWRSFLQAVDKNHPHLAEILQYCMDVNNSGSNTITVFINLVENHLDLFQFLVIEEFMELLESKKLLNEDDCKSVKELMNLKDITVRAAAVQTYMIFKVSQKENWIERFLESIPIDTLREDIKEVLMADVNTVDYPVENAGNIGQISSFTYSRDVLISMRPCRNQNCITLCRDLLALNLHSKDHEVRLDYEESTGPAECVEIPALRGYQKELAEAALDGENCVIISPTGSGKTLVAVTIAKEHLKENLNNRKVVFTAPTGPLIHQQYEYFRRYLSGEYSLHLLQQDSIAQYAIEECHLLFTTPAMLVNAIERHEASFSQFSLLIIDECHRADKGHPFNQLLQLYDEGIPNSTRTRSQLQIVGLSAILGVGKANTQEKAIEHILGICANMKATRICKVTRNIQELRRHVYSPHDHTVTVGNRKGDEVSRRVMHLMHLVKEDLSQDEWTLRPEFQKISERLRLSETVGSVKYITWLEDLRKVITTIKDDELRIRLRVAAVFLDIFNTGLMLNEVAQSIDAVNYITSEIENGQHGRDTRRHAEISQMWKDRLQALIEYSRSSRSENPLLSELKNLIQRESSRGKETCGIVFCETRNLTEVLESWMNGDEHLNVLNATAFHADMSDGNKKRIVNDFSSGIHKLLISTTLAEEGMDIKSCSYVIRYNHGTNEISRVQARGRGRAHLSNCFLLTHAGSEVDMREKRNHDRELLYNYAIDTLSTLRPHELASKIEETMPKRVVPSPVLQSQKSLNSGFSLRCISCDKFITIAEDLRRIQNAHYVTLRDGFFEDFEVLPMVAQSFVDFEVTGTIICSCRNKIGNTCLYKTLRFPMIAIKFVAVLNGSERIPPFKKWKSVPFQVMELTDADLCRFLDASV